MDKPDSAYLARGLLIAIALVVVGAGLRFTHLTGKVYWHDEAYSSLRIFGHTGDQYYRAIFNGNIHSVEELRALQYPDPALGMDDTIAALASRPEHPPLYYLAGRLWSGMWNDPVLALRSLSALIGLLLLPAVYLLMRELFDDPWISWTGVALVSVSPLHLLYSQEARQYGLWTVITALSCALFLRSLRTNASKSWNAYALSLVLGFYTHVMYGLTVVTHIVYLIFTKAHAKREQITSFARSVVIGLAAFIPWLVLLLFSSKDVLQKTGWMRHPMDKLELVYLWLQSINRLFFDFPGSDYLIPVSVVLVILSLLLLVRKNPPKIWLLPVLLVVITGGVIIFPDILFGGRRSIGVRYLLPTLLALQLCVAWMIGVGIKPGAARASLVRLSAVLLIIGGVFSQITIVSSDTWWNKYQSNINLEVAAIVNASERPLLISMMGDINPGEMLSMSYHLGDHVKLLLFNYNPKPEVPPGFDRILVYNPGWELQEELKKRYSMISIHESDALWELREIDPDRQEAPPI